MCRVKSVRLSPHPLDAVERSEVHMVKIVDVAARAGVSTATVSRVLNGTKVRADLEAAVHQAIDELGYVPDRTARSLRRRHSDVIALDRKSTRLNSSHVAISYAVFCLIKTVVQTIDTQ